MFTVVSPGWGLLSHTPNALQHLERCGRVCYKSEDRITDDSAAKFIKMLRDLGHESVFEHASMSVRVMCSRACSHQLVRHRLGAYSQESQRYVDYKKAAGLQVICPPSIGLESGSYNIGWQPGYVVAVKDGIDITDILTEEQLQWGQTIEAVYQQYTMARLKGTKPEDARFLLPNATKTELAVTFNFRQWRHVFKERALNSKAQWEIRELFLGMLMYCRDKWEPVFGDL